MSLKVADTGGPQRGCDRRSIVANPSAGRNSRCDMAKPAHDAFGTRGEPRSEGENACARPIVTEVASAGPVYPAEDDHQQYDEKRRA